MLEIPGQDGYLNNYFYETEMRLIKWIFSFPAAKSSLQFQINYKIGFDFGTHCSILDIYSFQLELS